MYSSPKVACGYWHSIALARGEDGLWPRNDRLFVLLLMFVSQSVYHDMCLFTGGQIFSWGQNRYSQLGLGITGQSISTPQMVQSLQAIPFSQISAGGAHSFALTFSGAVFGWGCNKFGQLGVNDTNGGLFTSL
ncbi:hypothetical protein GOODEAATRI_019555 [Goodea atripinnis]|uniref:Regulator of chromosome condensation 1 n=1 Tax=Goodea atripinnis TaxID=208336 RepID=A0ABV0NYK9_9TELE